MADQVTGNEGGPITYEEADNWMTRYRNSVPSTEVRSELFGINKLNELLKSNPTAKGIRVCYSLDENNVKKIIIFAVDADNHILTNYILERGNLCPPNCPSDPPKP